ncbi:MAG: COX15/CtaA family protein [Planctomycetota bacterium]|jgi:cytochrome c oxidase assembly protein subunit 15|nr:COX15/CtaA family protein [Planctomycetota bacterium]
MQGGSGNQSPSHWGHRLSFLVAALGLLMIVAGATVTTTRAGDADPEWNFQFWRWFPPISQMNGNLFYEHLHREIGTLLGFAVLALALVLWRTESRSWVRKLGFLAVLLVCLQGALGGLRVLVVSDPGIQEAATQVTGTAGNVGPARIAFAMTHATLAQAFFSLLVVLALVTSRFWIGLGAPTKSVAVSKMRRLALITTGLVFVQLLLGTFVRHSGGGVHLHLTIGLIVVVHLVLLARRALLNHPDVIPVRTVATVLGFLGLVQMGLGFASWGFLMGRTEMDLRTPGVASALFRSSHVALGALVLAGCVSLVLLAYRFMVDQDASEGANPESSSLEEVSVT